MKDAIEALNAMQQARRSIIPEAELSFTRRVACGSFKEVWEGTWKGRRVALAKLQTSVKQEINILANLSRHPERRAVSKDVWKGAAPIVNSGIRVEVAGE